MNFGNGTLEYWNIGVMHAKFHYPTFPPLRLIAFKPYLMIELRHFRPFFIPLFHVPHTILHAVFTPILPPNAHRCARLISEHNDKGAQEIVKIKRGLNVIKRGMAVLTNYISAKAELSLFEVICQN
jgi:hypothetical protein